MRWRSRLQKRWSRLRRRNTSSVTDTKIRIGGTQAYSAIGNDYIRMPPFECFRDAESRTATLAHDLTHWARPPSRLDRNLWRKKWEHEEYAIEELVAESGSAFLCPDQAITPEL